ncbi:MAG: hypothetical protein ACKOLA_12960, partial [Spartobacteria bacterium]
MDFWNVARASRLRSYVVRSQARRQTYMNACKNPQPWRLWHHTKIRMLLDFWNVARASRLRSYVVQSQTIQASVVLPTCLDPSSATTGGI